MPLGEPSLFDLSPDVAAPPGLAAGGVGAWGLGCGGAGCGGDGTAGTDFARLAQPTPTAPAATIAVTAKTDRNKSDRRMACVNSKLPP